MVKSQSSIQVDEAAILAALRAGKSIGTVAKEFGIGWGRVWTIRERAKTKPMVGEMDTK